MKYWARHKTQPRTALSDRDDASVTEEAAVLEEAVLKYLKHNLCERHCGSFLHQYISQVRFDFKLLNGGVSQSLTKFIVGWVFFFPNNELFFFF